jgi:hypothetical protein
MRLLVRLRYELATVSPFGSVHHASLTPFAPSARNFPRHRRNHGLDASARNVEYRRIVGLVSSFSVDQIMEQLKRLKGGTITLTANGKNIGEGRVEKTTPFKYSLFEGQDIGEDTGSPIDFSYTPPFKFAGELRRVTVELK